MEKIKSRIAGGRCIISCPDCRKEKVLEVNERFDLLQEKTKFAEDHSCDGEEGVKG